jgi:hypothetical protein
MNEPKLIKPSHDDDDELSRRSPLLKTMHIFNAEGTIHFEKSLIGRGEASKET